MRVLRILAGVGWKEACGVRMVRSAIFFPVLDGDGVIQRHEWDFRLQENGC